MHRPARRGEGAAAGRGAASPEPGEVYLEYIAIGSQMKVAAVDAATGVEVTVFGPASVSREYLGRIAVRKLERRLAATPSQGSLRA